MFICILIGIFFFVYEFCGGRFIIELVGFINKDRVAYENVLKKEIFGDYYSGSYGGIMIKAVNNGVFVFGDRGLKFFKNNKGTVRHFYNACTQENIEKSKYSMDVLLNDDVSLSVDEWGKKMRQGHYVFMKYIKGSHELSEVWGWDYWYFDNTGLVNQCKRF